MVKYKIKLLQHPDNNLELSRSLFEEVVRSLDSIEISCWMKEHFGSRRLQQKLLNWIINRYLDKVTHIFEYTAEGKKPAIHLKFKLGRLLASTVTERIYQKF